jgi:hypothetical protein
MSGLSDYFEQNMLNYLAGSLAMPALPSVWMALFTAAPTSDAGTGGTEVPSTNAYARQQVAGPLTTNGTTASGNPTLHFASVPSWIVAGMLIRDSTSPSVIPAGTTVLSTTSTTVTMSANATGAGVGGTDVITFSIFAAATASSGNPEPNTVPGSIVNSSAVVTFPQATGTGWGTVVAYGLYDAATTGNLLNWDYLGNFKWIPFSCSSASPGIFTTDSAADVPTNGSSVVVTQKYGGTLPTTAGSFSGLLTTAGASTNTFNVGVNTTSVGGGQFRQVAPQPIAGNVTPSFGTNQFTISSA